MRGWAGIWDVWRRSSENLPRTHPPSPTNSAIPVPIPPPHLRLPAVDHLLS